MALYSIDGRGRTRRVTYTPHEAEFNLWRSRLTAEKIDAIRSELRSLIDGDEVHTAGWMPGNDWTGTVWEPIYTDACQKNIELSGYCFGLFVWEAIQEHPEAWSFGRYEKDGIEIRSLTYFRISHP